jgi:hypothetical protein
MGCSLTACKPRVESREAIHLVIIGVSDIANFQFGNGPNQRQQTIFKQRITAITILRMGKASAANSKYLDQPAHITS